MDHEEWLHFVWEHREHLIEQLKSLLPEAEFTNIAPGLYPIFYLQRPHGRIELNFEAVKVGLDDERNIKEAEIRSPPDEEDERRF